MSSRLPSYSNPDPHAVAIIGLSISAPGGEENAKGLDVNRFYDFLRRRGSGIVQVPADRWNSEAFHGTAPGKICTTKGGFIPDFTYGDLQEFGITPAEGAQVAVTQIALLHQTFSALERSGIDYRGTKTGVYVGCAGGGSPFKMDITQAGAYYMTGSSLSITSNRISYVFDLLGPSLTVDTACSSSLTAMHLAVQAIRNGECDQAVVAGVNFILSPLETSSFSQLGVLSPDGVSKSFDDGANGYARGDVASAVVIKRHDLAVRDHDYIHATLVGSSLTSCGSIMGSLTTPSPEAQSQAIRGAFRDAGLRPNQADFVELHGTGTVVGDSIEANTAGMVFSEGRKGREVVFGSVKSNIGHGEMGAYMSSLVKVVLMLTRKRILPNGYFETPSKRIDFQKYRIRVPTAVQLLKAHDREQGIIASISSYGFGGSCGHTVLREHESRPVHADFNALQNGPFLFAIGALSPRALNLLVQGYKEQYDNVSSLALCEHLGRLARQMPWRTYAISDSLQNAKFRDPVLVEKRPNPIILCFSGQGPQHWQQGRSLMATYSVFRQSISACDEVHKQYTGRSFLQKTGLFLIDEPTNCPLKQSTLWPADVISVAITFFQIALFDLITSFGIKPTAVVGHSIGETAVLYASGAMPRDMAVKIAIARGRALALVDNIGGSMVAVSGCSPETMNDYLDIAFSLANIDEKKKRALYLAAFNGPTDTGVSGSDALVDLLTNYINNWADGITAKKLRVSTAVHSPFVDPCEESYRSELNIIFKQYKGPFLPLIPTMSTVTADFVTTGYTVDYLWRNLRQPVLFSSAVPNIISRFGDKTTFVEISPHPVLSQYVKSMGAFDCLGASMRPSKKAADPFTEARALLHMLGGLLLCGVNSINFSALNGCPIRSFEGLPYPFQMKHWPFAVREASYLSTLLPATPPLNSPRLRVSPRIPEPWMSHHVIDNTNLIPAAAYIEMALEFPGVTQVWDCFFETAFILEEAAAPGTLQVKKEGLCWSVKSSSQLETAQGDLGWTRGEPEFDVLHAHGKLGYGLPEPTPESLTKVDVQSILARCLHTYEKAELYAELDMAQFGPEFMRAERACVNETEAIFWLRGHVDGLNSTDYIFHPALMDAAFQAPIGWNMLYDKINTNGKDRVFMLPHSLRRGYRNDGTSKPLVLPKLFRTYARLNDWSPHHWTVDVYVLDDNDTVLFTFEGLHFKLVTQDSQWPAERYTTYWQPRTVPYVNLEGTRILEKCVGGSEAAEALRLLDQLAVEFTHQTLQTLPSDFVPQTPDRIRYLSWAKATVKQITDPVIPTINPALHNKYTAPLELTERVGLKQKDIMSLSSAAVELLFSDDIMDKVYECPPFTGPIFDETVAKFIQLVKSAFEGGKRVIRVLEVGSGTGRMTKLLGQALSDAELNEQCYVDYVCTDISISFAQESVAKSPWLTMTPMAFDLNLPNEQQNLDLGSFDIIVAFDVIHATSNICNSLRRLYELLLPGGHLVGIELDGDSFSNRRPGTIWANFIFGCFSEWLGVLEHRPGSNHCTLSPLEWRSALDASGFDDTLLVKSSDNFITHLAFFSRAPYKQVLENGSSLPMGVHDNQLGNDVHILHRFSAGGEVQLVRVLSGMDSAKPYVVWLYTDMQKKNLTLIGLTRSIRHEFAAWRIMLVLFDSSWDQDHQHQFINTELLPLRWVDAEVMVDKDGQLRVPRIIRADNPPQTKTRDTKAIEFDDKHIWRAYPVELEAEDVEVAVAFINLSPTFPGCSEFSGTITAVGPKVPNELSLGQSVSGISPHKHGTVIVCHYKLLVPTPQGMHPSKAAAIIGRLCFTSSVVAKALAAVNSAEPRILLHAGSCPPAALATIAHLQSQAQNFIATAQDVSILPTDSSPLPKTHLYSSSQCDTWSFRTRQWAKQGVDIAFCFNSDADTINETTQVLSPRGILVLIGGEISPKIQRGQHCMTIDYKTLLDGNDVVQSVTGMTQNLTFSEPSVEIFDLDQHSLAYAKASHSSINQAILLNLSAIRPELPILRGGVIRGTPAFDPRATYMIIGGVGGLGASIAQCLVENGARTVVLTSRSGEKAFRDGHLVREKKMVQYLRSIPGVTIDILAVDCLDVEKTKQMFAGCKGRIAGVFYIPVRLNDQLFTNLTSEDDWEDVYDVKVKGLKILTAAIDPKCLDFLVLTSSMATVVGSPGQSNYAAAQSEMEAIGASLPNTVSVTVPPIVDGGIFVRSMPSGTAVRSAALDKYKSFGMTGLRLAEHCVDAIWALNSPAATPIYIPPTDWKKIIEIGVPKYHHSLSRHLLVKGNTEGLSGRGPNEESIRAACAMVLSLDAEDVDDHVPLSSYGLDSLTSVRLSTILKQHFDITVTQLQLLGSHMTVEKLQEMQIAQRVTTVPDVKTAELHRAGDEGNPVALRNDWDQTIVRLNSVTKGQPMFIISGAGGGVSVLQKMARQINLPVYGVQDTPEAPITGTLEQLSSFYLLKIREQQPFGPYVIGGFSFGAAVAVNIAQALHKDGIKVKALILLDGAPTLFHRPLFRQYLCEGIKNGNLREDILKTITDMATSGALDEADEITNQFKDHFEKVATGGAGPKWVARFCKAYISHLLMGLRHSQHLLKREKTKSFNDVWPSMRTVLFRADKGIASESYAAGASRWFDLEKWAANIEVHEIRGSHFGILNPLSGIAEIINKSLR